MRRCILLGLAAAALLSAGPRVRLGGVAVSGGYTHGWAPGWWGPGWFGSPWGPAWRSPYWGFYDPFWYGPMYHPGFLSGFAHGPAMGEVKLTSTAKDAVVLIDGAYAGEARKLKSMWLQPGVYNVTVRDNSGGEFEKKVYVLTGKTLELRAEFRPKREESR